MVKAVGCDLVEISRIESAVSNLRFFTRVFTEGERAYAEGKGPETLAGMWAAKEAVSKAFGTGVAGFSLKDIEIVHNELGCPGVQLHGAAQERFEALGAEAIHVSISHAGGVALAFVVFD